MAGGHGLSRTSLGIQGYGVLVGATCRPSESAGLSALRQASLPCQKKSRLLPFCTSPLLSFLGDMLGPGYATVLESNRKSDEPCQSCHGSMCSCLIRKREMISIIHMAALATFLLSGLEFYFCLFFFFLKGEKEEKNEFARYVTDPVFGGWRWFVSKEKSFVRQTADLLTVTLIWCQLYLSNLLRHFP